MALIQGCDRTTLVLMPDLTAGCCALTALAASASSDFLFAFTLCQLGYFSFVVRLRGRQFTLTRQQLADGFGKCQLDFSVF